MLRAWRRMASTTLAYAWETGHSHLHTWLWRIPILVALLICLACIAWTCALLGIGKEKLGNG